MVSLSTILLLSSFISGVQSNEVYGHDSFLGSNVPNNVFCEDRDNMDSRPTEEYGYNLINLEDRGKPMPNEVISLAQKYPDPLSFARYLFENYQYAAYSNTRQSVVTTINTKTANCGDFTDLIVIWGIAAGYSVHAVHVTGHYYAKILYSPDSYAILDPVRAQYLDKGYEKEYGYIRNKTAIYSWDYLQWIDDRQFNSNSFNSLSLKDNSKLEYKLSKEADEYYQSLSDIKH